MATGQISGLVVVDCDSAEAVERFVECYPPAKNTCRSRTGRGQHFFFQFDPGIRNSSSALGQGIDVRGGGGYVILPPSIHASGQTYAWINDLDPLPLPEALKKVLSGASKQRRNPLLALDDGSKISAGFRNTTLTSLAGSMRNRGMSREAIEAALLVENKLRCNPSLPEEEVKRIALSIATYDPTLVSAPNRGKRAEIKIQTWEEFVSGVPDERKWTVGGICGVRLLRFNNLAKLLSDTIGELVRI